MNRLLGLILAFMAALTQIASGALPSETPICIRPGSQAESCCCCDDDSDPIAAPAACPCHPGCDRCLTVRSPDGRAMLTARPRTSQERPVLVVAMSFGPVFERPRCLAQSHRVRVRPNESPPDIPLLRTVRLVL